MNIYGKILIKTITLRLNFFKVFGTVMPKNKRLFYSFNYKNKTLTDKSILIIRLNFYFYKYFLSS